MDASFAVDSQHRYLGTSMPSGGVHPIAYVHLGLGEGSSMIVAYAMPD